MFLRIALNAQGGAEKVRPEEGVILMKISTAEAVVPMVTLHKYG
jgi:hypothetical protein